MTAIYLARSDADFAVGDARFDCEVAAAVAVNHRGQTGRETAGNSPRTLRVRNLSFSLRSLLALALRLVRIRQATTEPRSISLPTNICGYVALAAWLRMGTEGTRKLVRLATSNRWRIGSRGSWIQAGLFPSLNQFETLPTHHSFCGAVRQPSPAGHVPRNLVPMDGEPPANGVVVEAIDRPWWLAVFRRERILVPEKLVGLRKTYGWRLSLRERNFLPFQHLRQRKYKSVLELFAVGRSACVALRGEDMPSKVACASRRGPTTSQCVAELEPRTPLPTTHSPLFANRWETLFCEIVCCLPASCATPVFMSTPGAACPQALLSKTFVTSPCIAVSPPPGQPPLGQSYGLTVENHWIESL